MYTLQHDFGAYRDKGVIVVGCGGTGGFVAEGLCRLLSRSIRIVLMDQDVVETTNLFRQNFLPQELGRFKAQALAERLARQFNREVGYSLFYLREGARRDPNLIGLNLIVGCVDNHLARRAIASFVSEQNWGWWIDAGNAENWGQVLIGNSDRHRMGRMFDPETERCVRLPMPTIQRPELLLPPAAEEIDPDCAEAIQVGDQSPTINQAMASLVLEVVRRLLLGTCPWMSLFLDLDTGELKPTYATPEVVSRMMRVPVGSLVLRPR